MTSEATTPVGGGPYYAEFGAIHHEDQAGFLFTVTPAEHAGKVADALNRRPTPSPAIPDREEIVGVLRFYADNGEGCRKLGSVGDPARQALDRDGGNRARSLLAKLEGGS